MPTPPTSRAAPIAPDRAPVAMAVVPVAVPEPSPVVDLDHLTLGEALDLIEHAPRSTDLICAVYEKFLSPAAKAKAADRAAAAAAAAAVVIPAPEVVVAPVEAVTTVASLPAEPVTLTSSKSVQDVVNLLPLDDAIRLCHDHPDVVGLHFAVFQKHFESSTRTQIH